MTKLTCRTRGFTLIELLTVIGIIAVLAAILFPVFSKAREKARQTACMANLQQLGIAIESYVSDYGGFLPTWSITHPYGPPAYPGKPGVTDKADPSVITWDLSIMQYVKDNRILMCRSNPNGSPDKARAYAIAQYTQRYSGPNLPMYGCYKDSIPTPSQTVLLFEKGANPPGAWGDALGQNVNQSHGSVEEAKIDPTRYSEAPFHNGGKNFLFVDGHVKWYVKTSGPFSYKSTRSDAVPGDCIWASKQKADGSGGDWPEPE